MSFLLGAECALDCHHTIPSAGVNQLFHKKCQDHLGGMLGSASHRLGRYGPGSRCHGIIRLGNDCPRNSCSHNYCLGSDQAAAGVGGKVPEIRPDGLRSLSRFLQLLIHDGMFHRYSPRHVPAEGRGEISEIDDFFIDTGWFLVYMGVRVNGGWLEGASILDAAAVLSTIGIAAEAQGPPGGRTVAPAVKITGKSITYDQIVDMLLLSPPGETQRQLAAKIGYSEAWLSRMISSDAFQVRLQTRIEKDIEPERQAAFKARFAGIEEEARGILLLSLKKLSDKLTDPANDQPELLIKTASMASKMLGYGARQEPAAPKVEMHLHLEQLAQNVRNLNTRGGVTIDQAPGVAGGNPVDRPGPPGE